MTVPFMSRMTGRTVEEIQAAPIGIAEEYAGKHGVTLLLKGPTTIVTDGMETILVDAGCPGMATAGSGDVLSGILAATASWIPDPLQAAACAAYVNGKAGEAAQEKTNPISMTAGDTVSCISDTITGLIRIKKTEL